jgi:NAD(P)-dependent dehydrogenase (short-subunit alcohol dehydrogenase family)
MVSLTEVKAANAALKSTYPSGSVAVFVGGTSGLGEGAMKLFASSVPSPVIYFIGRSRTNAETILADLKKRNAQGRYEFLQADLGRLAAVKAVCKQIKDKESKVDLLVGTTGNFCTERTGMDG